MHRPRTTVTRARRSGQALIETAIFGSVILMILGIMVGYGLNYDYNQSTLMRSFRAAVGMASAPANNKEDCERIVKENKNKRAVKACQADCNCAVYLRSPASNRICEPICHAVGTGNFALLEDRHVPDPTHPYGLGSTVSSSSSARVVRDHSQHLGPDTAVDLPRMRMRVAGIPGENSEVDCPSADDAGQRGCTTAGYRIFNDVTGFAPQEWIQQKRGRRGIGWDTGQSGLKQITQEIAKQKDQKCVNWPGNGKKPQNGSGDDYEQQIKLIDKLEEVYGANNVWLDDDGDGDPDTQQKCFDSTRTNPYVPVRVKVLDPCGGELVNKELCQTIAKQLNEQEFCTTQCERSRRFVSDCRKGGKVNGDPCLCGTKGCRAIAVNDELPDCAKVCAQPLSTGQMPWYAVKQGSGYRIDELFQGGKVLGLQPGSVRSTTMSNSLTRRENATALDTDTSIQWTDETQREFLYRDATKQDPAGRVTPTPKPEKALKSIKTRKDGTTWSTPWQ
jgi:hypothetical protein